MTKHHHPGMVLIAGFKAVKGILLFVIGLGLLRLVHAEIATMFSQLLERLRLNSDAHLLHKMVLQVDALQPQRILTISIVTLTYAALLLTEGLGLWFERSWAAYLTVISTNLFLPFELYELIDHFTALRVGVFLLNLLIVIYLIRQLRRHTLRSASPPRSSR